MNIHIEIDQLYEKLAELSARQLEKPDDIKLQAEIEASLEKLNELQKQEAEIMINCLNNNRAMNSEVGRKLMKHADKLIKKYG